MLRKSGKRWPTTSCFMAPTVPLLALSLGRGNRRPRHPAGGCPKSRPEIRSGRFGAGSAGRICGNAAPPSAGGKRKDGNAEEPRTWKPDALECALGTGNNDDSRSNALWGKGGRGLVTMMAAVLVLGIPIAASAGGNSGPQMKHQKSFFAPGMLKSADKHKDSTVHVIVTVDFGALPTSKILDKTLGRFGRNLDLINGAALDVPAKRLHELSDIPGLTITPDAPVHLSGYTSKQLWVPNTGVDKLWNAAARWPNVNAPTI